MTKANLFFARSVAIVEGDAEALVLPALAQAVGRSANAVSASSMLAASVSSATAGFSSETTSRSRSRWPASGTGTWFLLALRRRCARS
ncbi:TOPRIM nucleotidyl transferase/hydrolase domain-containing protein [Streptomyces sp. NBC_00024]|uniref:TOPRIM nucleotidyl transferase/hydrolase domain-containing protein n=1 Tax=Streptomyces sp. NBC_00024 TaxID=2903612 RepID=UPI0038634515